MALKTAPSIFVQLFTILGGVSQSKASGHISQAFYLSRCFYKINSSLRMKKVFESVLYLSRRLGTHVNLHARVMSDFELAIIDDASETVGVFA